MSINYSELPFYTAHDSFNEKTKNLRYRKLHRELSSELIAKISTFHVGTFHLCGTNRLMPDFIISDEAKKNLYYPQGFCIMESEADYFTNRSGLESYELRFTLDGQGKLEYEGQTYTLNKGDGFLIDCRRPHLYYTDGDFWNCTILHLDGSQMPYIFRAFASDGDVTFHAESCPNFEMLQFQLLKATQKIVPYHEYKLSCLIDILLTEILTTKTLPPHSAGNDVYSDIISYIQEHFAEDLTLDFLVRQFAVSRTNLCREFKRYTGFTFKKYVLTLRINHAKQLLGQTALSVEETAAESGFHDTAHFVQMFKQTVGVTPLQYRKGVPIQHNTRTD